MMIRSISITLLLAAISACGVKPTATRSDVKDLAADKNAKNIALIIGAPNDLEGVPTDIAGVSALFKDPSLGFEVVVKNRASKNDIIAQSVEVAKKLDSNSTLFWYYSGHGLEDGALFAQDQRLVYFKSVISAMKAVRTTPFKRLIVVMDSCFSGQNVDGSQSILSEQAIASSLDSSVNAMQSDLKAGASAGAEGGLFEQAIIIGAARKNQTSLDAGVAGGGVFTSAWRKVLANNFRNPSKTIGDMVQETIKATYQASGGQHTPVFKAVPESILQEPLKGSANPSDTGFDAFLALDANETTPYIFAGLPLNSGVSTAVLCEGAVAVCRGASPGALVNLSSGGIVQLQDRLVMKTEVGVALKAGATYTVIFKDSSGIEKGFKTVKVTAVGS